MTSLPVILVIDTEICVNRKREYAEPSIYIIRGQKVMLDADLAILYGIPSRRLNEQVKRNLERFPQDFMFQLTEDEWEFLRSQIATLKNERGKHRKYLPYVFTEQGVAMLSSVLRSSQAIKVNTGTPRNRKGRSGLGWNKERLR